MARELTLSKARGQAVVKITCPDEEVALKLAEVLVSKKVAACVNIIPAVTSVYRWKGEICRDSEVLLLVKTRVEKSDELLKIVADNHPYDVPEVLWTAVECGSQSYLKWLDDCLE